MNVSPLPDLNGRTVLLTGGSSGTSAHVARAFARQGAAVALTYHHNRAGAEDMAAECRRSGAPAAAAFALDLASPESCSALVPRVRAAFGRLDVFVGVAGTGGHFHTLLEADAADMQEALQGHVTGNFLLARQSALAMPDDGSGRVVFVSATSSTKFSHGTYGFAKAALNALTEFLAHDLAARRITVNTVVPQLIDLPTTDAADRERRRQFTPLGRLPHPDEIAQLCVTLCAPLFGGITGQLFFLDGGYRLRPPEDR
ncbi:MAG: SDR family oxidoreductase [Lentisphaerae bacterium]|nr:SDR family oxidoreductase [Lentisphaerota bacterium]